MKFLKIGILLVLLTIATSALALEQEGGLRFFVGEPTGEFGDKLENPGFGVALQYGLRPHPAMSFGAGMDLLIYGSESTRIRLPLVEDFDLTTTNNLGNFCFFAQWRPLQGPIQPYAEARFGWRYLWTESKLEDKDWWDDEEVARETNYDDFTTFWSGGGGLLIRLSKGDSIENKPGVFLDFKITQQRGGEATYLTEGDIDFVNNLPVYSPSTSETDMITYEVGVVLTF